jgi:hypothetical protein
MSEYVLVAAVFNLLVIVFSMSRYGSNATCEEAFGTYGARGSLENGEHEWVIQALKAQK